MKKRAIYRITRVAALLILPVALAACAGMAPDSSSLAPTDLEPTAAPGPRTIYVAPPTGEQETDRASILAALEQVEHGGTIQFAPGTYLLGGFIPVSVSGITLLGHPSGTTLRGCDPAVAPPPDSRVRCNTLALIGSRQVVRNLTFEYMSWGLTVGMVPRGSREFVYHPGEGGHLIEGNTFRDSFNGVRVYGDWPESVVVRGNRFINTYHAGDIYGRRVHFLNNDISAPDPSRLTPIRHVGAATQITPLAPAPGDVGLPAAVDCEENVIAGNRYDGHPDAILMEIDRDGSCRNNVIRDNTIIVRRARFFHRSLGRVRHETDSTFVGIPLRVADYSEEHSTESRGVIENNVIEGNRIIGGEGLGIMLHRASRNRVADNTITGIRRREPFPGNVLWGIPEEQWRHANGSAIWVSPGSEGNRILGNTFEQIAGAAVVLDGDSNRVELRSATDAVSDLGRGNTVTRSASAGGASAAVSAAPSLAPTGLESMAAPGPHTIYVAPPTGDRETDRASILAAVEQVEPGGTIQFAPGTYLIGAGIRIEVARLTLRGHPQGTTLRGCDPDEFATYGIVAEVVENCGGLRLLAGHQSVHDLTFEYASTGLYLGLGWEPGEAHRTEGGDRIMNNTFGMTGHGIILDGDWPEPTVIRNNRFINSYHALVIFGATAHVLDNHFSVPEPERVPIAGFPDEAVRILPRARKAGDTLPAVCGRNVVAGNRIEGTVIGIEIRVREADTSCEGNVIRDNWIAVTSARVPEWSDYGAPDDSRIVYGVALALNDLAAEGSGAESDAAAPRISGNVIEGNRIIGGSGPAIQLYGAAGNRIVDNTITGVRLRETYPGHTLYFPPPGTDANGSGIWISHGSDDNEILGNTFEDIASYALVIEGDSNRVTVRDASDAVRDLGRGNLVRSPAGKFLDAGDVRLQYLDFGGEGLPLVFIPAVQRGAQTWASFAPRFTDRYRALALTARGVGESEGEEGDTEARAGDLISFLDALDIERAVFIGNSGPGLDMTYLAEHHPDRVAGLVYLANVPPDREFEDLDPSGALRMAVRALYPAMVDDPYRPGYLDDPEHRIDVPALTFVGTTGYRGWGNRPVTLLVIGRASEVGTDWITDPEAKAFFERAVADEAFRDEVRKGWEQAVVPARRAREDAFRAAFGEHLRVVELDVPFVTGYQYLDEPDLIEPHVRRFLDEIVAHERRRPISATHSHPAGEEILDDAWARHFALWFDVESGRRNPPPPEPEERRKYHGYP